MTLVRKRRLQPVRELKVAVVGKQLTLETPWVSAAVELAPSQVQWAKGQATWLQHAVRDGAWIESGTEMAAFVTPFLEVPLWIESWSEPRNANDPVETLSRFRIERRRAGELAKASAELTTAIRSRAQDPRALAPLLSVELAVTRACDAAIRPAVSLFPYARTMLEDFLAGEAGHDALLLASLERLSPEARAEVWLPDEAKRLIAHLEATARRDFLGLCAVIDLLESVAPVWNEFAAMPGASDVLRGARKHETINEREKHAHIAYEIAATAGSVSDDEVTRARACATEAVSLLSAANRALAARITSGTGRTPGDRP